MKEQKALEAIRERERSFLPYMLYLTAAKGQGSVRLALPVRRAEKMGRTSELDRGGKDEGLMQQHCGMGWVYRRR